MRAAIKKLGRNKKENKPKDATGKYLGMDTGIHLFRRLKLTITCFIGITSLANEEDQSIILNSSIQD
jgi:hypothetical protein